MKKTIASMVALTFVTSSAFAATVDMGGPYVVNPGDIVPIVVTVDNAAGGNFNSFDIMFGSDTVAMTPGNAGDPGNNFDDTYGDWAYSAAVEALVLQASFPKGIPVPNGSFPEGTEGAGAFFLLGVGSAPLELGTLTIDTTGLAQGDHYIYVGNLSDGDSGFGDPEDRDTLGFSKVAYTTGAPEGLQGTAVITVVPEPATLALLGLGAIGFISRRKKA